MDHFEIDEIELFVDITLSTFGIANVSQGLSGVHWQQTLYMGLVRKHPIGVCGQSIADSLLFTLIVCRQSIVYFN